MELTEFTIFRLVRILGLFVAWVCLYFLDSVCCFCGVSEASGAHSETFGFVRILIFFRFFGFGLLILRSERSPLGNFWVCSKFGFLQIFRIWFVVFAERAKRVETTQFRVSGLSGLFAYFGFVGKFWLWFVVALFIVKISFNFENVIYANFHSHIRNQ